METILEMLEEYKKGNRQVTAEVIQKMNPLLRKYAYELEFLDFEDAMQELSCAIIQSMPYLLKLRTEGECVMYLVSSVRKRAATLANKHKEKQATENTVSL